MQDMSGYLSWLQSEVFTRNPSTRRWDLWGFSGLLENLKCCKALRVRQMVLVRIFVVLVCVRKLNTHLTSFWSSKKISVYSVTYNVFWNTLLALWCFLLLHNHSKMCSVGLHCDHFVPIYPSRKWHTEPFSSLGLWMGAATRGMC